MTDTEQKTISIGNITIFLLAIIGLVADFLTIRSAINSSPTSSGINDNHYVFNIITLLYCWLVFTFLIVKYSTKPPLDWNTFTKEDKYYSYFPAAAVGGLIVPIFYGLTYCSGKLYFFFALISPLLLFFTGCLVCILAYLIYVLVEKKKT